MRIEKRDDGDDDENEGWCFEFFGGAILLVLVATDGGRTSPHLSQVLFSSEYYNRVTCFL